jgi:thioredoxin 1
MKHSFLWTCILLCLVMPGRATEIVVNFSNFTIEEARKKAAEEGKLLFVDFHAKWCTPCKWMDQTTFKDESVAMLLNSDFVAVKIDIDDYNGYAAKKTFDVKYLPTMLIFNSEGKLIERVEETLSPRLLTNLLNKHNLPENKIVNDNLESIIPQPSEEKPINSSPEESLNLPSNEQYRNMQNQYQSQTEFKVQVGVFSTYDAAQNHVTKLKQTFLEPITVINEIRNGETLFKVRMGQFPTYEEADSFRVILKNDHNLSGIVQ